MKVWTRGEARRPDIADHIALPDPRAWLESLAIATEMGIGRGVGRTVFDLDVLPEAAVAASADDHALSLIHI